MRLLLPLLLLGAWATGGTLPDTGKLTALPAHSPGNASYTIEARLEPGTHTLQGGLVLEWRNTSGVPLRTLPFHLYWNAFENNLSTLAMEEGRGDPRGEQSYGFTHLTLFRLLSPVEGDLLPTLRYSHPDGSNASDHTVAEVETPVALDPGATARFRIEWTSRIPYGAEPRSGWTGDYFFIGQWFPKIGVFWKGAWNCHEFHANTEFFADFGTYDVRLTLPRSFVVGGSGQIVGDHDVGASDREYHFVGTDIHDFAWTASPRFRKREGRFAEPGYPEVELTLLVQPEHADLQDRYLEAARTALRGYGSWSAPYPYPHLTIVDPAWNSGSGGMEYPTLFTGAAAIFSPGSLQEPEGVTIHEAGHQFWYGLVANNEFEEAWLDEGLTTFHEGKLLSLAYGPSGWARRYFGPTRETGIPVVAPGVFRTQEDASRSRLREYGSLDAMARRGWEYRNRASYGVNSYGKPALVYETLERLVGEETMTRILQTYARRYRFQHPTTRDFIDTVGDVTGKDWQWFFDETFYSSEVCDYAVSVSQAPAPEAEGFEDTPTSKPVSIRKAPGAGYRAEVTVERKGGVRMPVELLVQFQDGGEARETWDGAYRWKTFSYPKRVRRAVVDPDSKLVIDIDPSNNSWIEETGPARRASTKWGERFLFWLQNLLELELLFS